MFDVYNSAHIYIYIVISLIIGEGIRSDQRKHWPDLWSIHKKRRFCISNFVTIWFRGAYKMCRLMCIYIVKFFLQTSHVLNANVTVLECCLCQTHLMGPSSNIQREFDMYQFDYLNSLLFKFINGRKKSSKWIWECKRTSVFSNVYLQQQNLCNFYVFIVQQSQHRNHLICIHKLNHARRSPFDCFL